MKEGGPRNLTLALGTAVLLGLFLGGATYVRTATNQERLRERNLRELARIARSVEGRVNDLERIVQSLARTRLDSLEYKFQDPIAREYDATLKAELIPFLELDRPEPDSDPETACSAAATTETLVDLGRGTIHLSHTAVRITDSRVSLKASIRASWSLEALRSTLEADYFDAVLIADDSGQVLLASSKASGLRLRQLTAPSLDSASAASDSGGARREGVSSIRRDTLGGREYHLFLQPVGIQVFDRRIDWTVAGLVPVADLRRESVALGPSTALFLMLFVVIGLLLAPFVRVSSMGPRERMEVRDVFLLLASLVLASGLFGLLLADLAHYWRLRDALYEQASSVAQQLASNLDSEVQTVLADLDSLSNAFSNTVRRPGDTAWTHQDTADLSHRLKTGLDLFSYPARHMVFWTNPRAQQVAKWTPRLTNTARVEVDQRDYFTRLRDRRGWPRHFRSPDDTGPTSEPDLATSHTASSDGEYYLESIRSTTTGEHLAALSRSFCWNGLWNDTRCPTDSLGISVAITKLVTLDRPILPSGFEFAVVEAAGKTLFHSRQERNLEENFVEETGDNKLLRSVLEAGTSRHLDATYRGRRTRLFVQPLSQRPISVIIVLDKAQLETLHFEAWFVGTVLLTIYALLLLVWLVVIEKATARRMHWVWPDREDPKKHSLVLVIFGLFGGMLVLQIALAESFPASLGSFLIPFQALGLGLVVLSSGDRESRSNRTATRLGWGLATVATLLVLGSVRFLTDQTSATQLPAILVFVIHIAVSVLAGGLVLGLTVRGRGCGERSEPVCGVTRAYTASMVVGLLVVGVLPGYLFYQLVFSEHLELLVRQQQAHLADRLIDREARLNRMVELYDDRIRDASFDLSFQRFLESCYWIRRDSAPYSDCFAGPAMLRSTRIVEEPSTHGPLHSTLSDRVPWLTVVSVSWRQLAEPQADRQWRLSSSGGWTRPQARFETRWLLALGQLPHEPRIVIRSSFPTGIWRPTYWWAFASIVALVLIILLVRWLSRRVFLINLGQTKPVTLEEVLYEKAPRSLIVVCTRSTDREPLTRRDKKGLHYVNLMAVEIDAGGTPRLPEAAEGMRRICFDYFDHRFQEPEWNQRLLGHLEELVYEEEKKVLVVSSRDPHDLIEELAGADESAEPDRRRWARLLGQFARVSVADEVSPAADFETPGDTTRPELYSVLRRECNGRGKLQEIGRQVLSRSDFLGLTPDALVDHIRDAADTHYAALWAVLGEEEQLVVAQLAAGAVANPRCGRSVRLLLCRELIERGPELRLMNSSFGRFVRETVSRSTVRDWEKGEHPSTWQLIRIPFVVGLLALAVFLAYAEPGAFGKGMAFLGTTIAGLATVARILTLYQKGPADAGVAATR